MRGDINFCEAGASCYLVSCNLGMSDRTVIFVHHIEGNLFSGSMTTNSTLKYIIYSVCYTLIEVIILC